MTTITEVWADTGETVERPMTDDEMAQRQADEQAEAARLSAIEQSKADRLALLERLGITEAEAALISQAL